MADKLLLVSWTLYPWTSGSAIIVNNIAKTFSPDELVLFGETEPNRSADQWPTEYPKIHYTNPNINVLGRGQRYLRWLNINRTIKSIRDLAIEEKATKILCVFPNDFYLYATYKVSRQLGLPLYTWFHNTYLDNYTGLRKSFAKWFQPKIFKTAQRTFVMSDGMLDFYREQYPEQDFTTLVHGFPLEIGTPRSWRKEGGNVKFVFTGSLNASCDDAAVRMMSTILRHPEYEVHVYTGNPEAHFSNRGLKGPNFFYHGFIQLADLYDKLGDYDIMLLPHGLDGDRTDAEFKTIFPTRTIPLLVSNRPILAHSPQGVFLTKFLRENDCAELVDHKSETAIETAIEVLLNNEKRRNHLIANAHIAAQQFHISAVVAKLKAGIDWREK